MIVRHSSNDQEHKAKKRDGEKEADNSADNCYAGAYDEFTHGVLNSVS